MVDNESMEGKDIAFEYEILEVIKTLPVGQAKINMNGIEVENYGFQCVVKFRNIPIILISDKGDFEYNKNNIGIVKTQLEEEGKTFDDLGLPDLYQMAIDKEEEKKKAEVQQETEEQPETREDDKESDEENEEEKGDETPDIDEDKEELAKKYNVDSKHVIHVDMRGEKLTKDDRFKDLVDWAGEYDEMYIIPEDDEFTYKAIARKKKQQDFEEIANLGNQQHGTNPNVLIRRIDGEQIQEVSPLATYGIDDNTMLAIVKDEHGETEMLYCRKQEDKEEYFGIVVPEADIKNQEQVGHNERDFMDYKNNAPVDLTKKAQAYEEAKELEEKGVPSKEKGIQVDEIEGNRKQNMEKSVDEIVRDLKSRDGIVDELTVQPGFYENKAKKILELVQTTDLDYEQAIEQVENESQREDGGMERGPKDLRYGG